MSFDFDAAVSAPFRMQPGLRRMADGAAHLTPVGAGSRHPRLNAHPANVDPAPWPADAFADPAAPRAWWRTERQTFIALLGQAQAVFTIQVQIEPLASAIDSIDKAVRLHEAIATMSQSVLAYRSLTAVRAPLLAWLAARAA